MEIERGPINNATGMPFTPAGNIVANNVQGAIEELDTEKAPVTQLDYESFPIEWGLNGTSPPGAIDVISSGNGVQVIRNFAGDGSEDVLIPWEVPDDIDVSQGINFQVAGLVTSATPPSNEGISFKLSGYSIGNDDALNGAFGAEVESNLTAMSHAQYDRFLTDWSGIVTVTNLAAGELAILNFYRDHDDADDTYVQDIGVATVKIRFRRTKTV